MFALSTCLTLTLMLDVSRVIKFNMSRPLQRISTDIKHFSSSLNENACVCYLLKATKSKCLIEMLVIMLCLYTMFAFI